jgi:hypothetical protein
MVSNRLIFFFFVPGGGFVFPFYCVAFERKRGRGFDIKRDKGVQSKEIQ